MSTKPYPIITLAKKYINYYINSYNNNGHGIHSPFVYDFIRNVLKQKQQYPCYEKIETLRKELKSNHQSLQIEDLGAGSAVSKSNIRSVKEIAQHALKPKKLSQLLFRIANYYQSKNILELGTSLGITASYLASVKNSNVFTIEGSPAIAEVARQNFNKLSLSNITLEIGHFDILLPGVLQKMKSVDLAFIDGNHAKEPTLRYFEMLLPYISENSIIIFDDIHWSKEMEGAWNQIKAHNTVRLSIDLFFLGIVFFKKAFKEQQEFTIRF